MSVHGQVEGYAALIVEDDKATARAIASVARSLGYLPTVVHSVGEATSLNMDELPELLLIDLGLPDGDGLEVIAQYKSRGVHDIIVISGTDSQSQVTECLRAGARDFLCKPVRLSEIQAVMQRAIVERCDRLPGVAVPARSAWIAPARADTASSAGVTLQSAIDTMARHTSFRCLLSGPAGVGKQSVAASIHEKSQCTGNLICVSCAHENDAAASVRFMGRKATGDRAGHVGYLEQAAAGTLVLDDVSCLSLDTQRLINDHLQSADGQSGKAAKSACSIIAILREPAEAAIHEGRLLQHLYYRLASNLLEVPRLVDRYADLGPLVSSLVSRLNASHGVDKSVSHAFTEQLNQYHWPGNALQLKQLVKVVYASTDADEEILPSPLIASLISDSGDSPENRASVLVGNTFRDVEIKLLQATLAHTDGNKRQAADLMKISLKTIYNRLSEAQASLNADAGNAL